MPKFLCILAFEVDQQAKAHRAHNTDEPVKGGQPRRKVGKGRATVANATRLLELPDEVKQLVASSLLSVGHAKVLLSVDDEKERILLARDCVNDQLTVRALERKVARRHAPVEAKSRGVPDLPDSYNSGEHYDALRGGQTAAAGDAAGLGPRA